MSELARRISSTRQHIFNAERGNTVPTIGWLEKFSEGCGFTVGQFIEGLESTEFYLSKDPFIVEIASMMKHLSISDRRNIMEVVKKL